MTQDTATAPTSQPIDIDLPCVKCGYNLRTLASDATCTECGTPVAQSRLLPGFQFKSRRAAKRVRRGLAVLVIAMLIWALAKLLFWLFCRYSMQIHSDGWRTVLIEGGQYGSIIGQILRHVAILIVCVPFGPRHCNAHHRLGLAVGTLAVLAAAGTITHRVLFARAGSFAFSRFPLSWLVSAQVAGHCDVIAVLLMLIFLLVHLRRSTMGHLPKLLWVAMGTGLIRVGLGAMFGVYVVSCWLNGVISLRPTTSPLLAQVGSFTYWAGENVVPVCWIVILMAVGLYYRRLNLALRFQSGDRIA